MNAILAGLGSTVITELYLTWSRVSRRRANQLRTLAKMKEPAGNFSAWRSLLATTDSPCVPFIDMYLTDITQCNDQFPDTTVDVHGRSFIHFQKRRKWADAVSAILRHQAKPFLHILEVSD
jgi:son of sevenless-like protein